LVGSFDVDSGLLLELSEEGREQWLKIGGCGDAEGGGLLCRGSEAGENEEGQGEEEKRQNSRRG
jgi:hypothetical protein